MKHLAGPRLHSAETAVIQRSCSFGGVPTCGGDGWYRDLRAYGLGDCDDDLLTGKVPLVAAHAQMPVSHAEEGRYEYDASGHSASLGSNCGNGWG